MPLSSFFLTYQVGYSYDAGANTFLFTTAQYYNDLLYLLSNINILSHTTLYSFFSLLSP